MKFDRGMNNQLINYYEYFLKYRESISTGIPFTICDWYLLVGLGPSAIDYPLVYAAIYVDERDEKQPIYIYVEMSEDEVVKFAVGLSFVELMPDLPQRALRAVNAVSGGSIYAVG